MNKLFIFLLSCAFSVKGASDSGHKFSGASNLIHSVIAESDEEFQDQVLHLSLGIAYPEFKKRLETARTKYHEKVSS